MIKIVGEPNQSLQEALGQSAKRTASIASPRQPSLQNHYGDDDDDGHEGDDDDDDDDDHDDDDVTFGGSVS